MKLLRTVTLAFLGAATLLLAVLGVWFYLAVRSAAEGRHSAGFQPDIAVVVTAVLAFGAAVSCAAWGILADLRRQGRMKSALLTLVLVFVVPFVTTFFAFVVAHELFPVLQVDRHGNPQDIWGYLFMSGLPVVVGTVVGFKLVEKEVALKSDSAPTSQDNQVPPT